jgi:Sec23/Sec24 helical domain
VTLSAALSGTDRQGKVEADRARERQAMEDSISLASSLVKSSICVDIFLFTEDRLLSDRKAENSRDLTFLDAAVYAENCDQTGGHLHYISGSMLFSDNVSRIVSELEHSVQLVFNAENVMKLRSSKQLKLLGYYGSGRYDPLVGEVELAGMDAETCVCFTLRHDSGSTIMEEEKIHLQLAVLHTNVHCKKVVRVLNLTLTSSSDPSVLFRHSDLDCTVAAITKIAAHRALTLPLSIAPNVPISGLASLADTTSARDWVVAVAVEILKQYRMHCSPQSSRGLLILPEPLKLLPLYTLGILKHSAFSENVASLRKSSLGPVTVQNLHRLSVRASERAFELRRLLSCTVRNTVCALYPRFYSLRSLTDDTGGGEGGEGVELIERSRSQSPRNSRNSSLYLSSQSPTNSGTDSPVPALGTITLPPCGMLGPQSLHALLPSPLAVTSEALESDGLYLLDDGSIIWLIVGKSVPIEWLECVIQGVDAPLEGPHKPQKILFLTGERSRGGALGAVAETLERVVDLSRRISGCKQGTHSLCLVLFSLILSCFILSYLVLCYFTLSSLIDVGLFHCICLLSTYLISLHFTPFN